MYIRKIFRSQILRGNLSEQEEDVKISEDQLQPLPENEHGRAKNVIVI